MAESEAGSALYHLLAYGWAGLALAAWLGLCIGSFLNVVIHRLPIMLDRRWTQEAREFLAEQTGQPAESTPEQPAPAFNLLVPRSRCPACGHTIRVWENIPVISWLLLRGRCSECKTAISLRYPVVELLTAIATVAVIAVFGITWSGLAAAVFTWSLIALTGIDFDTRLLPDEITLPLLWLGLLGSLGDGPIDPAAAIVGATAGYLVLWTLYWAFRLLTGKEGMGYGDFKLLAAIGAWLGWEVLPAVLLLAALTGLLYAAVVFLLGRRARGEAIAFGPFLAVAGWIALLQRENLLSLLLPT